METIVLYPSPGMGHLISMVEFGKFILNHHPFFTVAILTVPPSFNTGSTASYIDRVSATNPSITFHHLPSVSLTFDSFSSMEVVIFETLRLSNPNVQRALQEISSTSTITSVIIDFFCTPAFSIFTELGIPTYYFFTSGVCCLDSFLYVPTIHRNTTKSFKDMNSLLDIPGLPPIPSSHMPDPILDRSSAEYAYCLDFFLHLPKSAGVIVNSFESLESKSLKAISEGSCNPDGPTPPVFCVGPLLATERGRTGSMDECLKWLDLQPSQSVVFLCFGSLGLLSGKQLKEIAIGLERSEQRFLWVVRSPPSEDKSKRFLPPPEPDLESLLPSGFLDRTKDRGFVVKSWAPQVEVLRHKSVGGFVTHCGWNSVLEALCAGVPMVAWPLYAEQKFNRVVLVDDLKLALRMNESEDGFVTAEEVESRVRELMDSKEGESVRKRTKEKEAEAKAAMSEGGTSIVALAKLVESWKLPRLTI
ncbi:UDP-glycosyltransferase 88B1-like [Olea europaea var. sylvestris]|uniref:UDP-glycosyltransferase 88B1-like n=1 Tax=Olea europaea var. sylvestris TaxID=158386 RepID=UPI000C1D29F7|nr:UDP-glycosyltransferase 88B1-like [Olea europaea var. sylvestris]